MKLKVSIILSLLLASTATAKITNIESEGNLKSETTVALKNVADITNKNNPVDLYQLIRTKMRAAEYTEAAEVFAIATAYGMYDMGRVPDRSAHQAISVLRMNSGEGLSAEVTDQYQEAINNLFKNPKRILELLDKVGKPDYHPAYMIQHGMGAFTGNTTIDGLSEDFDPDQSWQEILDGVKKLEDSTPTVAKTFKNEDVMALVTAVSSGDTSKADLLIKQGVDINTVGKDDITPLRWTFDQRDKFGFEYLLKKGANPNERHGRESLLEMTLDAEDPFYLETALKHGGDPSQTNYWMTSSGPNGSEDMYMSLIRSTISHRPPIHDKIRILIEYGAVVQEKDGRSLAESSASMNQYEQCYIFLEAGANYSTNREKKSSLVAKIENRAVHPDSPEYEWLEKVVQWLAERNIEVTPKKWD